MSKRKRRSRRRRTPNLPGQTTAAAAARRASERKEVNLAEDYAYVAADLGRIALIAGGVLAALVALSFILR